MRLALFMGLLLAVACSPPSSPTPPPGEATSPAARPSPSAPAPSPVPPSPQLPTQAPSPTEVPAPHPTPQPTQAAIPTPSGGAPGEICGYLRAGVEAGCLILQADDGKEYLLVFRGSPPPEVKAAMDKRICVRGHRVEVVSYCMQGTPLAVDSFRVVSP